MTGDSIKKTGFNAPLRVLEIRDNDLSSLKRSSSGGAFAVIARHILSCYGVVYGAKLFDDGEVRVERITEIEKLHEVQGSKYVLSNAQNAFGGCLEDLKTGKQVLFTGLPCQIFALKAFLEKRLPDASYLENLITIDLICHGAPDPRLFKAYLLWLADVNHADGPVQNYSFRWKEKGWGHFFHYRFSRNGKMHTRWGRANDDPYFKAFSMGTIFRECCYRCSFACRERVGDFTIGDYWGVEKQHPEFSSEQGVSALLINTDKGCRLFDQINQSEYSWIESDIEFVARGNENLNRPSKRSVEAEERYAKIARALDEGDRALIFDRILKVSLKPKQRLRLALSALKDDVSQR